MHARSDILFTNTHTHHNATINIQEQTYNIVSNLGPTQKVLSLKWLPLTLCLCCVICRCCECGASLSHWYYEKDGRLFCKKDYWAKFGELCHGCSEPITTGLIMVSPNRPKLYLCHLSSPHNPACPTVSRSRSSYTFLQCSIHTVTAAGSHMSKSTALLCAFMKELLSIIQR